MQSEEQYPKQPTVRREHLPEPKGQDIMKADAEGAGSEANEFAEGDSDSTAAEPGDASDSAGDETTIGIP